MATTTRSEERGDGMTDGMTSGTDNTMVLKVLELQFLREISDDLRAVRREMGLVPGSGLR